MMNRFRPTIESLDGRVVPSAVMADSFATESAQVAEFGTATGQDDTQVPTDGTTTAKVTVQDFHFVMKVSKSSPILH